MSMKSVVFLVFFGIVAISQVQSHPLLKAKLLAAPVIVSKAIVGKEVFAKKKLAVAKGIEAVKAAKSAAVSAITAPFRVVKKSIAIKVGAIKALKAIKLAKAGLIAAPVIALAGKKLAAPLPIPVPIVKSAPLPIALPQPASVVAFSSAPVSAPVVNYGVPAPVASTFNFNPIKGLVSGAQGLLSTAGNAFSVFSNFAGSKLAAAKPTAYVAAPTYRYVPEIAVEQKILPPPEPHSVYGLPSQ